MHIKVIFLCLKYKLFSRLLKFIYFFFLHITCSSPFSQCIENSLFDNNLISKHYILASILLAIVVDIKSANYSNNVIIFMGELIICPKNSANLIFNLISILFCIKLYRHIHTEISIYMCAILTQN